MPPAQKEYVLVSSEWYLNAPGDAKPATLDLTKAEQMTPDWVTFNGYAAQYKTHPLTANPGDTVRFWVVDAGPSLNTEFHVVGTILKRAWINADMVDAPQHDIQTAVQQWVEKGVAPEMLIATKYVSDQQQLGIQMQRPLIAE